MKNISRIDVVKAMEETGMMPLFYHADLEVVKSVVKALYEGGARLFEFTHRGAQAMDVFKGLINYCEAELPEMILGIGSVPDGGTASYYLNLGAKFVVTPVFRQDIAIVCNRRKVLWSPGCGSLKEIAEAEELGCEIVKLFPANTYGPDFIKAVMGPQPWTKIMPTGGITTDFDDLEKWFKAGAVCVGMGSQLISKQMIAENDFAGLTSKTAETIANIKKLKQL